MPNRGVLSTVAESNAMENDQQPDKRLFNVCMFAASDNWENVETFVSLHPDKYPSLDSSRAADTCLETNRTEAPNLM